MKTRISKTTTARSALPLAALPLAALLLGALAVFVPVSAHADEMGFRDVTRDVHLSDGAESTVLVPRHKNVDVTWFKLRHGTDKVTMKIRVRDLIRTRNLGADFFIRTSNHNEVMLTALQKRNGLRVFFSDVSGTGLSCDTAAARFSKVRDFARVVIPRDCLGDPRWVRAIGSMSTRKFLPTGGERYFYDSAVQQSPVSMPRWTSRVRSS